MKKLLVLFSLIANLTAFNCNAQTNEVKSILWEISKDGIAQKSYLLGTYHGSQNGIEYSLIDDRQAFSIRSEGNKGSNGGPAGDLRVGVNVRSHPYFTRDGFNVWHEINVSYAQAALGSEVIVPTIDGDVRYTIPAGTQPGTVFKLRDRGIPVLNGRGRGDQLVKVNVDVPKKLTERQKELLRAFDEELNPGGSRRPPSGADKGGIFGKKKK